MTVKKRNETLDIMKGFAMLVTIFCHAQQRAFCNNAVVSKSMIWQIVHWWHMPLFFIVSGILASRSEAFGGVKYVIEKARRLLYPWFVFRWLEWIFMRFEFSGLMPFNKYVPISFIGNLKDFILLPFRPMWFLFDLFLFFIVLIIIEKLDRQREYIKTMFMILSVALSVVLYKACINHGVTNYKDWGFLYYDIQFWGLFVYGYYYGKVLKKSLDLWKITLIIIVFCSVIYQCINSFCSDIRSVQIIVFWTGGIIWTSFIGIICKYLNHCNSIFAKKIKTGFLFMGRNSLEYYTLQFLFLNIGYTIRDVNKKWTVNFIGCIFVCTMLIILFKKVPVIDSLLWGTPLKNEVRD